MQLDATPPIGKIHTSSKIAISFEYKQWGDLNFLWDFEYPIPVQQILFYDYLRYSSRLAILENLVYIQFQDVAKIYYFPKKENSLGR